MEPPLDVKSMKLKQAEQAKILVIVKDFEQEYFKSKQNYNVLDGITMNSNMTVKSLRHCYKINYKYLNPEDPDWDTIKIGPGLDTMGEEIDKVNMKYNGLKGQEMQLSEQIINKDTSGFKLKQIEQAKQDQDDFYSKIDDIDDNIYRQKDESNEIWQKYEDFNESLFKKKIEETTKLIGETNDLIKAINTQVTTLEGNYAKVKKD